MEHIYNIFLFFDGETCSTVGYRVHNHSGDDEDGIKLLKSQISDDLQQAVKMSLKKPFSLSEYNAKCRLGQGHHLFDDVFVSLSAGASPLFVSTPVKDEKVSFDHSSTHDRIDINAAWAALGAKGSMEDWLTKYTNGQEIDIPRLIHDDYFLAIKLTFNAHLYVSAMKLLVSCIDSLAYIEYGNEIGAFTLWLETYADLTPLGITTAELWELRNGILHMTNINSNRVRQGKMRRISFRVGGAENYPQDGVDGIYYFDFYGLIQEFALAQSRWIETYNGDPQKFAKFVERYDEPISDSRVAIVPLGLDLP